MEQLPESADRDIFAERYEGLRRDRPDDFDLSRDEYGRGFYS
ncbi:hypothetical protein OG588_33630 [Streptomyces prunicolor]|nr:hypothetical protein OG588_33630 [Streptomyces prunicolor]